MKLYPFQEDFRARFHAATARRILGVAPTGSGKTVMAAAIIKDVAAQFKNVLVLAHRREIVRQTSEKLDRHGVRHGVIQAGFEDLLRPFERCQVASIQTITARAVRSSRMKLPPADLIVIDEAHHTTAESYRKIIDLYPNAMLLGLTATPCRADGRGLGGIFEVIVEAPQIPELINLGHLVPTKCYAPTRPDLEGVQTVAGDYHQQQLADRMDRTQLIGDIVTHWHRLAEGRKTVCFATSVEHSVHIRDRFIVSDVRCEHIDGSTPKEERDETLRRLASGELQVVTNCQVLTEGWDCPEVSCCILARPTKSFSLFRQMIGRVLRPAEGKTDAIVIDHSGAIYRHGLVEDTVEWTLSPDTKAEAREHTNAGGNFESSNRLIECSQCGHIREGGKACPHCGFLPQPPPRAFTVHDGDLGLVEGGQANATVYDDAMKRRWWAELTAIELQREYKSTWAAVNFREKFGHWPGPYGARIEPQEPSAEVRSWVQSRMIRYARRRQREDA